MEATPSKGRRGKSQKSYRKSRSQKQSGNSQPADQISYLCYSADEDALVIPYSLWVDPLKSFVKGLGARWCSNFKVWRIPCSAKQSIQRELPNMVEVGLDYPPIFVDRATRSLPASFRLGHNVYNQSEYDISQNPLLPILYPFQQDTLHFCLQRHGRILIADEMGVGKSVQALACALIYQSFPLLIICPSALKHVWKAEVTKWMGSMVAPELIAVIKKGVLKSGQIQHAKVVITSYEIAAKLVSQLQSFPTVICDEAHYLKNPESQRAEHLMPFLTGRERLFLLTGTPALSQPKQLFPLLTILRPDIFVKLEQFGRRYCYKRVNPWSHRKEFNGARNVAELHYLLKSTVMIRRMKEDVLPQLPAKQRQVIAIATDSKVVKEIKEELKSQYSLDDLQNGDRLFMGLRDGDNEEKTAIMRCFQLSGVAKLAGIKEYIGALVEGQAKMLVFAHHQAILDDLEAYLGSIKCEFIRIDGSVTPLTRAKRVQKFQEEPQVRVALLSITAAGVGFTLTAASTVVFAELHWTPALLMQAQDRAHRIGQASSVNVHFLVGEGTLDAIMLKTLQNKIGLVGQVLNGQKASMNAEMVQRGGMGDFQPSLSHEDKRSQLRKITDYFPSRLKSEGVTKKKEPLELQEEDFKMVGSGEESQDSMLVAFMSRKREQKSLASPDQE